MSVLREALEALGHPGGGGPEPRRLADLFVRFQAQVPLRPACAGLRPEGHLEAWLEEGAGLCGEERTSAFAALAAEADLALAPAAARHDDGRSRSVLLADGGRLLLDPSFPLPAPLPLDPPAGAQETGYGTLSVGRDAGGLLVRLEARGEERTLYRVEPDAAAPVAPESEGGAGFPPLFRLLDDRLLRWADGILEVTDAWSRLRVPFPAADAEGLEALFGPPIPPIPPAPAATPATPLREPSLSTYLASGASPEELRAVLADPERLSRTLPDGWTPERGADVPGGYAWTLREGETLLRTERLRLVAGGAVLEADGPLALFRRRELRLERRTGGTRLRLLGALRDAVPPRGLPEPVRRRLVFELASELLALDRVATERGQAVDTRA